MPLKNSSRVPRLSRVYLVSATLLGNQAGNVQSDFDALLFSVLLWLRGMTISPARVFGFTLPL